MHHVLNIDELQEKLRRRDEELDRLKSSGGKSPRSGRGDARRLQARNEYLEQTVQELERDRSRLLIRATTAEEQMKEMQEETQRIIADYEKRLNRA